MNSINKKQATEEENITTRAKNSLKKTCPLDFTREVIIYALLDGIYATLFFDAQSMRWEVLLNRLTKDEKKREAQLKDFWNSFQKVLNKKKK